MNNIIKNGHGNERCVEIPFVVDCLKSLPNSNILDVGGMPTDGESYPEVSNALEENNIFLEISDFRGGNYVGNFLTYPFDKKFDAILFLSSIEHFPQCTEGDMIYREGEDIRGFKRAIELLKPNGKIFMTVPYGKPIWQPYHQNYNMDKILEMSEGMTIEKHYTYKLIRDEWILSDPNSFDDIYYTNKAFGVGCFVFKKEGE